MKIQINAKLNRFNFNLILLKYYKSIKKKDFNNLAKTLGG